jgi:hypothetical protein
MRAHVPEGKNIKSMYGAVAHIFIYNSLIYPFNLSPSLKNLANKKRACINTTSSNFYKQTNYSPLQHLKVVLIHVLLQFENNSDKHVHILIAQSIFF